MVSLCSFYHITIDHLPFRLSKTLTPIFIFVKVFIPKVYEETEKYFTLFSL
ncbi:hypothetical protein D1AOALGA4SA_8169 [Olavius algarvensis Delta 1 endosymbiont]|nr:hypothetical protein D1AOALGA4SA_8169 [Olavius algarvensis Delta 1 endosymbiont]